MKLTWYGHACFKAESSAGSVVFDPYSPGSVPGIELPAIEADTVFCSHGHGDHNYESAVKCSGRALRMEVKHIPCFHDDRGGALRGENRITVIDDGETRLAHFGDLGHELTAEQLTELGRIDVLLIPVGGYYTIDADIAAKLTAQVRPRLVIPMHYRGEGFGYNVIGTADRFAEHFDKVKYMESSGLDTAEESGVVILKCPNK